MVESTLEFALTRVEATKACLRDSRLESDNYGTVNAGSGFKLEV